MYLQDVAVVDKLVPSGAIVFFSQFRTLTFLDGKKDRSSFIFRSSVAPVVLVDRSATATTGTIY